MRVYNVCAQTLYTRMCNVHTHVLFACYHVCVNTELSRVYVYLYNRVWVEGPELDHVKVGKRSVGEVEDRCRGTCLALVFEDERGCD